MRTMPVDTVSAVFAGSGELPTLCRALDWSATALGSLELWPQALRSATRICLDAATIPMAIWAGRDLTLIYNDAYAAVLGPHKHPSALGRAARDVWPESWDRYRADLRQVIEFGQSVQHQDERFVLRSEGRNEEAFFSYAFTPIRDEHGVIIAALNIFHETTERVQSATRREDFLSWALTIAGTGAWDLSLADLSSRRSLQHEQIFGYDHLLPDWTYDTFLEHVLPQDRADVDRAFRRAAESGSDWNVECRIRRRDGERRWIWASGRYLPESGSRSRHMVGIVQDITERKEAEERLRVSEARLKFAQEAAGAGMWHWDLVTGEVEWSDQLYRLFGLDPRTDAPASGASWRAALHPDDATYAETQLAESIAHHSPLVSEHRIVLPTGEVRWVTALGKTTYDAEGRPQQMSGICLDTTERKRAEEALRRSEALARERLVELEALYETAPIGLCVFDEHLRWVRANKVIAEINGRPIEDHIGRTPMEVVPDVGPQAEEALRTILRTGERLDFEMTGTTAAQSGVERCWSEHWVPIKDPAGRITGISVAAEEITDRKRAARALAESEERFRTLADNIAQFAWMADETGSIFWYNKRWYDYTGTTLDEMQGWGWQKVHHPDYVNRVVEKIRRSFATGTIWEDTFPLRGKDGTYRWFLSCAIPIRHESGQVVRWFGTNTDITEQRAVEEALRVSERRYRTLAENAPEAIARFDRELRYTYVNDYGARLHGLSANDMLGRTDTELGISPARAAFWKEQFEQVTASGKHRTVDFEFDSPVFGRQFLSTVLVPEPGEHLSILTITRDVTPLKRAENSLRESEARFRRLADAMPQFVWTARPDGTIDYYNERVKESSGVVQREDGTWTWQMPVHPEDLESTLEAWRRAVQEGRTYEVTHRLTGADGTTHWYLTRAIPIRDSEGRVGEWFGTTTDIDVQKRTEEALREADRQKNQFMAMLSHDLRNPFAVIRTSLALLEQAGADSPHGKRALAVLGRQVNQMGRLLDDLLDVTRIAKGKLLLKREPLELNAIVRAIGEDHAEVFERERIEFQVIVPPRPLWARVDTARLMQAIGNLLQNAAKFTVDGGRVTLALRTDEGGDALIEVSDTGAGIQPELLDRLFDPLMQAHRTLHQSRGGLGLGLAVVKGIVELHGGVVWAASDGPGRGAVFTIQLPLESRSRS